MFNKNKESHSSSDSNKSSIEQPSSVEQQGGPVIGAENGSSAAAKKKAKLPIVPLLLLLVIGGVIAGAWFYMQTSDDKVVRVDQVCGDDTVAKFNEAIVVRERGQSDTFSNDTEGLNNLLAEVEKKDGYENDPTCQTIVLELAIINDQYEAASGAYNKLKELNKQGNYSNNNLKTGAALVDYENIVESLPSNSGYVGEEEPKGGA